MIKGNIVKKEKSVQSFTFNGSNADSTLNVTESFVGVNKTIIPSLWKANEKYVKENIVFCAVDDSLKLFKAIKDVISETPPNEDTANWTEFTKQFFSHTHENKTILDGITQKDIDGWNSKSNNASNDTSNALKVWQPNTYYEGGDKVIIIDENRWCCFVKNCVESHTSGNTYESKYWSAEDLYFNYALGAIESTFSNFARNYAEGSELETIIKDLQNNSELSTVKVWKPNTAYKVGDTVIYEDVFAGTAYDILKCKISHISGDEPVFDYWKRTTYFRRANNAEYAEYAENSAYATQAYNYAPGGYLEEVIINLQENKSDKTRIFVTEDAAITDIEYDFSNMYNTDVRYPQIPTSIEFVFPNDEYPKDYHAGLTFSTGDIPPQIICTKTGAINWVNTDCTLGEVDGKSVSIFKPVANKRYNIVFEFDGKYFIAYVSGFTPNT